MRTALLWVITQRIVVISYRSFGTLEDGTDKLSWNVGTKSPLRNNPEERSSQISLHTQAELSHPQDLTTAQNNARSLKNSRHFNSKTRPATWEFSQKAPAELRIETYKAHPQQFFRWRHPGNELSYGRHTRPCADVAFRACSCECKEARFYTYC